MGAVHSTKISGNFGRKLNGSVRSNRKSFEKTGPPFEVVLFSRSDRLEFWLNGSRPMSALIFGKIQKRFLEAIGEKIRLLNEPDICLFFCFVLFFFFCFNKSSLYLTNIIIRRIQEKFFPIASRILFWMFLKIKDELADRLFMCANSCTCLYPRPSFPPTRSKMAE